MKKIDELDDTFSDVQLFLSQKISKLLRDNKSCEPWSYQLQSLLISSIKSEFQKLNSGKINWNLAQINVKNEKYERAIDFYRKAINHEYRPNIARSEIVKLQLKIKRGY